MLRLFLLVVTTHLAFCIVSHADENEHSRLSLLATADGRPAEGLEPLLKQEDSLADISNRVVDIIYARKDGMALTMDVYRPKQNSNRRAIAFIISGGFWSGPDYRRMPIWTSKIRELVQQGFTVFAVIHGSQPRYSLAEIRNDVPRAIRYIRHHSSSYEIEPRQIGLIGLSSGGHLALLAATSGLKEPRTPTDAVDNESSRVQAVVAYFPNSDLTNYGEPGRLISDHFRDHGLAMEAVFNFRKWDPTVGGFKTVLPREKQEVLRDLSPISHVKADCPPTLLLHGDQDKLVPIQQSRDFLARLNNVGVECDLFVAEDEGHTWSPPLDGETETFIGWFLQHLQVGR